MPTAAAGDPTALARLDGLVNQQAAMVAYVNDFLAMMLITLAAMPLVFVLRKPKTAPVAGAVPAAHAD
ncbi:MAG: EmrB/QacA family drug resistance transporter, partial [Rhodobacteraceae bacterium]|nr:EmrB/QacA family drug resistance transporter [Paracoccaceae bacterium]